MTSSAVLITGASTGIGLASAIALDKHGLKYLLVFVKNKMPKG
jgi:NADP-dependent 3-hydroxy acid dehydrogenase YdfG